MLCVLVRIASSLNIQLLCIRSIDFPELAIFASRPGAMINLHWLEILMARTLFHGPKGVRAIEVRLDDGEKIKLWKNESNYSFYALRCSPLYATLLHHSTASINLLKT